MMRVGARPHIDGSWTVHGPFMGGGQQHTRRTVKYSRVFTTACGKERWGPIGRVGSRLSQRKSKNHERATAVEGVQSSLDEFIEEKLGGL